MIIQIPSDIPIWPYILVIIIILLSILWWRKPSIYYVCCFAIFNIYILLVLDKTLLPIEISGPYVDAMRQEPFMSRVNFIPFYFGPYGTLENSFSTMILNIILTIPFGFGVNFVVQIRERKFFWLTVLSGFGIELAQLLISFIIGYPYRIIDINDVIMNTIGVLIGYSIFMVFAWFYIWVTQRLRIVHKGLAAYVYDIAVMYALPASPKHNVDN